MECNAKWHLCISLVTCRGSSSANAKSINQQVACPSDVTVWYYWYDGYQDGGENIRLRCGNSKGERGIFWDAISVKCQFHQYAYHLRWKSEQRVFYSTDTECVFYSLWQILPNKCDKKFIVCHHYLS